MHPGEEGEKKKKKKKAMGEKLGLPGWPHLGHQKHKKWSSFLCFTPQKITWRHYTNLASIGLFRYAWPLKRISTGQTEIIF